MMVAFLLLLPAAQCPDFLIAGVIMDMFFHPAYQVPVCIIAAILRRVLVLLYPADQLRCNRITAVIMVVAVALLLPADKSVFIAAVVMLVFFNPACGCSFQRDRRQNQRIDGYKDNYGRH